MTTPAIVSMLWGDSTDTLIELARQHRCTIITLKAVVTEALQADIEALGGRLLALESFISEEEHDAIQRAAKTRYSALQQAFSGEDWRRFGEETGLPPDGLAEILSTQLPTFLPHSMVCIEAMAHCQQQFDLRLIVVNEEYTWSAKLLVNWGRAHGVKTLHLAHAIDLERYHNAHEVADSNHYAVGSEYGTIAPSEFGVDDARLTITGLPMWDDYELLIGKGAALKQSLSAEYGLDPDLPWVTFFPRWASNTSAFMDKDEYHLGVQAVMEGCRVLWDSGRDFELIIKDRRQNARTGKRKTEALAVTLKLPKNRCHHVTEDGKSFTVASTLVISGGSNVSIEAAIVGVPALNLIDDIQWLLGPSFPDAGMPEIEKSALGGWLVTHFDGLSRSASGSDSGEPRGILAPRDYFAGPSGDGRSSQRVVNLITHLAGFEPIQAG